jgi:hypothetical protein
MKFCPVVPEICHGQVHASRKERIRIIIIKIKIIIRNGAKTISLQTLFGRLKYQRRDTFCGSVFSQKKQQISFFQHYVHNRNIFLNINI